MCGIHRGCDCCQIKGVWDQSESFCACWEVLPHCPCTRCFIKPYSSLPSYNWGLPTHQSSQGIKAWRKFLFENLFGSRQRAGCGHSGEQRLRTEYGLMSELVSWRLIEGEEERQLIAQSWGGACENKWFHVTIEAFWKHPGLGI